MRTHAPTEFALILLLATVASGLVYAGGNQEELTTGPDQSGSRSGRPVVLEIEAGEHFRHKLQIMPLINVNNPPQMAAWCETLDGDFIATLFVTDRVAGGNWRSAPADSTPSEEISRKEALPVWSRRSGTLSSGDNSTREKNVPDAVSAATPKKDFAVRTTIPSKQETVLVYFEVNNSGDFNETYGADARRGTKTYSGGEWGSGQPALVYAAQISFAERTGGAGEPIALELVGRSSADGSDGGIRDDLSGITTALQIIERIRVVPGGVAVEG